MEETDYNFPENLDEDKKENKEMKKKNMCLEEVLLTRFGKFMRVILILSIIFVTYLYSQGNNISDVQLSALTLSSLTKYVLSIIFIIASIIWLFRWPRKDDEIFTFWAILGYLLIGSGFLLFFWSVLIDFWKILLDVYITNKNLLYNILVITGFILITCYFFCKVYKFCLDSRYRKKLFSDWVDASKQILATSKRELRNGLLWIILFLTLSVILPICLYLILTWLGR